MPTPEAQPEPNSDQEPHGKTPRRFYLNRTEDISGVSGTGHIADGVLWPDGSVSIRWLGDRPSTVWWSSFADVEHVHGHGGRTTIVWIDPELCATLAERFSTHDLRVCTLDRDRAAAERDRYKDEYLRACQTIARMHEAATGRVGEAPARGVVEDVADLRAERDRLGEQLAESETAGHRLLQRAERAEEQLAAVRRQLDSSEETLRTAFCDALSEPRGRNWGHLVERARAITAHRAELIEQRAAEREAAAKKAEHLTQQRLTELHDQLAAALGAPRATPWPDLIHGVRTAGNAVRGAFGEPADAAARQPHADAIARGVQSWMTLDLHQALNRPLNNAADSANQGFDSWSDWWADLIGQVRNGYMLASYRAGTTNPTPAADPMTPKWATDVPGLEDDCRAGLLANEGAVDRCILKGAHIEHQSADGTRWTNTDDLDLTDAPYITGRRSPAPEAEQ